MDKTFLFLKEHKDVAFATSFAGRPQIRVFQVMKIDSSNLYFATSPKKEVYKQLQSNPAIEILGMAGNISVRCSGNAVFDVDDATAQEIYSTNPVLPRLYKTYRDLVYFRLPVRRLDYFDLTPTPPLIQHFEIGR